MASTVGAVWLNVLPSMRDFTRRLTKDATSAAARAATNSGKRLGADLVDTAGREVATSGGTTAQKAGTKIADTAGAAAGKAVPGSMRQAGARAGGALSSSAARAVDRSMGAALTASTQAATQTAMQAVSTTTGRALPAVMSAQGTNAGSAGGAALSRALAQSTGDLGSAIASAGPAITTALTGAVGGAVATASSQGVAQAGRAWRAAGAEMADVGASTTRRLTVPLLAAGGVMLNTAGDFEASMNRVKAVSGATGDQFDQLDRLAQDLGASTQYSASEAAGAMGYLAQAGFSVDDILTALPGTLDLAAAGQLDLADAADIASNVLTGYGLAAADLGRVNDILAKTFTSTNVDMRMLGDSFKYIAPVAKSAGLDIEEVSAAVGLLGNAGIQGEQAGTVLRGAISRLLKPTGAVKDTLDDLGVSVTDSSGKMRSLTDIFSQLEDSGASTSDMLTIFGVEAGPGMSALLEQGSGALADLTGELEGAGGTAQDIAGVQMEGLKGSLKELKSAAEGLMLAIADSGLLDDATSAVKSLTGGLQDLTDTNPELLSTATTIGMVVAALGPMVWVGGKVATTVGGVVTAVSTVAGGMATAGGAAADFAGGLRNVDTAFASNATVATRLGAAIRSQTLLWRQQAKAQGRSVTGLILYNTWAKIVRGTTLAWTAAQWALNTAWNAHPIGLIISGLVLLGVAVYEAYQHFEWFRDAIDAVGAAIMAVFGPVVSFFTDTVWPALVDGWDWVVDASVEAWDAMVAGWDALVGVFTDPPSFSEIITALKDAGGQVADWLTDRGNDLIDWAKELPDRFYDAMVDLGDGFVDLLAGIVDVDNLTGIGQDIADWLTGLGDDIIAWAVEFPGRVRERVSEVGDAALEWLSDLPEKAKERLSRFADSVVEWVKSIPGKISETLHTDDIAEWVDWLKDAAMEKLHGVADSAIEWAKSLPDKLATAVDNAADIASWIAEWGPKILAGLGIAIGVVVLGIPALLAGVAAAVLYVLGVIIFELGKWLWQKFTGLMDLVGRAIASKVAAVGQKFAGLRDDMVAKATDLKNRVLGFFAGLRDGAVSRVQDMRDWVVARASQLRDRALSVYAALKNRALSVFTAVRDRPTQLMGQLRDWVVGRATSLRDRVVGAFNAFKNSSISAFQRAKSGIEKAWNGIKSATKKPVQFVVDTVYNDGIRKVWNKVAGLVDMGKLGALHFATGGIYPGYTPGRDIGYAAVSGGEAIMRPEWTRAMGADYVHAANQAARSGGVTGVKRLAAAMGVAGDPGVAGYRGAYATGGIVPFAGAFANGGLIGRLQEFGAAAGDLFSGDLTGAAKKVLDPLIGDTLERFGSTEWGKLLAEVPKKMIGRFVAWLDSDEVDGKLIGRGAKGAVQAARQMIGTPYSWGGGGLNGPTTGIGRGAGTVGFDCSSLLRYAWYQAVGKIAPRTTYTQMPWVKKVSGAQPGAFGFPHSGHVFMGSDKPGMIIEAPYTGGFVREVPERSAWWGMPPWQYDQGGWLMPGTHLVTNQTGRPEPVLTDRQWADLRHARDQPTQQHAGHTFNVYETRSPHRTARRVATEMRDLEALQPALR
ncbi:phage tail tape measure protein [Nocardiopsis rhodophaea]|uniref:phage tail tape measure protein n=1 Tax=Nocardiopsis rhodophaea TaxID=280238 RepID=UPI0031DA303D